jgi:hypothetical protein
MLELELETAIVRAYPNLLPDLHAEGYQIKSSQAVLLGRRLDILLEAADGRTCIVELKAGAPPMPYVRDQILDYAECWAASYPNTPKPRLIVVGNSIPEHTRQELTNFGIESRAVSVHQVLDALKRNDHSVYAMAGLKLIPDDLSKVRYLLSDHGAVEVPEGLVFQAPWNHEKVFLALVVKKKQKHKELWMKSIYVQIYPQKPNCAVLYGPKVDTDSKAPLCLNPQVSSWNETIFKRVSPSVEFVRGENKGPGKERSNFDHYRIKDWDAFARALELEETR